MTENEKHEETRQEIEKEAEVIEEKQEVEEEKKLDTKDEKKIEKEIMKGKKTEEQVEKEIKEEKKTEPKKDFKKSEKDFKKGRGRFQKDEPDLSQWVPKTQLGKDVIAGKYKTIEDVLSKGGIILEPEIVDYLVPDLKDELIYIGGTPGKGGGIRRTPTRMTARMHKSGRRFKLTALIVVGNEDGVVGIGKAVSNEHRVAISKALAQAKLNVINVKRGCGSWECNCGGHHSIPYKTEGKAGSVRIVLSPTPTGVGIVTDKETRKIIKLAGIKDVWIKAFGKTSTRINLAFAVFEAIRNLSNTKGDI